MKRLLLLLVCWTCLFANAQERMKFKGISMGDNITEFVGKLEQQGYQTIINLKSMVVMRGEFAGEEEADIIIQSSGENTVNKVAVMLSLSDSWSLIKSEYLEFKQILIDKYGLPGIVDETFLNPYYEGDGYEIQAFNKDKATYATSFDNPNGSIMLAILPFQNKIALNVVYTDKVNQHTDEEQKNNARYNDL